MFTSAINLGAAFGLGEKSSSGHLEFSTLQDAVEALVICNHIPLSGASTPVYDQTSKPLINVTLFKTDVKWPYTTKLCFSTPRPGQSEQPQ